MNYAVLLAVWDESGDLLGMPWLVWWRLGGIWRSLGDVLGALGGVSGVVLDVLKISWKAIGVRICWDVDRNLRSIKTMKTDK